MDLEWLLDIIKLFTFWAQDPENTYYVFALILIIFVLFVIIFEIGSILKKGKSCRNDNS